MRLAMDARLMVGQHRGMGHFARALIEPVRDQVTAMLPAGQRTDEWPCVGKGADFYPWWEQRVLPALAARHGATHLLCPYNTAPLGKAKGMKKIVVLHDLIFLRPFAELPASPSLHQNLGRVYRRWIAPRAARAADWIVTVSEFSRAELCERFGLAPDRVRVLPNSIEAEWFAPAPLPDGARHPYLFSVSGEAPSKNLPALLRAFARLREDRPDLDVALRVAGIGAAHHGRFARLARKLGVGEAVRFEPFLATDTLRRLYREAWAFVLPSLHEGFGIPILEAMASGTPVACGRVGALPEVADRAASYFDPGDPAHMASVLAGVIEDRAARERSIHLGLERAARFRRDRVSPAIAAFWREVA